MGGAAFDICPLPESSFIILHLNFIQYDVYIYIYIYSTLNEDNILAYPMSVTFSVVGNYPAFLHPL